MHPGTERQTHWLDSFNRDFMFSASLVQLGTTRNYRAKEEKFLGFVLVYELACTELHGSGSFVKRTDPF